MAYGYNPYLPYQQQQFAPLRILRVSSITEANATPVNGFDPVFFYNSAENVVYKKQINSTGAAPIQTFNLSAQEAPIRGGNSSKGYSYIKDDFQLINTKLDSLAETFKKVFEKETTEKKNKKGEA